MVGRDVPDRDAVRQQLLDLLGQRKSRGEVADWASVWVREPQPAVDDPALWEALIQLSGADLQMSPSDYLHSPADFQDWLDRLEEAGNG